MRRFLECERSLLRYVMVLVPDAHEARDVVQNTAVALWKKIDTYDPSRPFLNWACRYALLEARQHLHQKKRWGRFLDEGVVDLLLESRERLADELDQRRLHLRECLRKLPADRRDLVEAYYFRDEPVEGIAGEKGKTVAAVYKSLQRIRSALMDCVTRRLEEARG